MSNITERLSKAARLYPIIEDQPYSLFVDSLAEIQQLQAQVAELEGKLNLIHERFHELEQGGGTLQPLRECFDDLGKAFILRKQAEAKAECLDRMAEYMVRDMSKKDILRLAQVFHNEANKAGGNGT